MALITYADKVALNQNASIPDINKVTANDMNEIKNAINNLIWPVGSYYETSDGSFDPNVTWGGTWQLDTAGKVTVAYDSTDSDFDTIGETGGSKDLQAHTHTTELIIRDSSGTGQSTFQSGNAGTVTKRTYTSSSTGNGNSGNLQPYIVVYRWHRTA